MIVETVIKGGRRQATRLPYCGQAHVRRTSHLFLGVEGLVRAIVLHFEFMAALVGDRKDYSAGWSGIGIGVVVREIDLRHLHCTIYTSSHIL